jgi:hypothetical protein
MSGSKVPLNMSVHYVSFSAHADYAETSEFVDILRPPHVVRMICFCCPTLLHIIDAHPLLVIGVGSW